MILITRIVELELALQCGGPATLVPDAYPDSVKEIFWLAPDFVTSEGFLKMTVSALLVETPSTRIIVDTGIGNDKSRAVPFFNMLKTNFLGKLESAGWAPHDVQNVLCTHLHADHVGWNTIFDDGRWKPTFPNARYHLGRHEYEMCSNDGAEARQTMLADSVAPVVEAGLASFFEMDAQILPELRLIPTPGHSPGHVSVVIDSKSERAVITADVMYHPCQVARPFWPSGFDGDKELSRKTRNDFLAKFADTPALVIGSHFGGPGAGQLTRDAGAFRLDVQRR